MFPPLFPLLCSYFFFFLIFSFLFFLSILRNFSAFFRYIIFPSYSDTATTLFIGGLPRYDKEGKEWINRTYQKRREGKNGRLNIFSYSSHYPLFRLVWVLGSAALLYSVFISCVDFWILLDGWCNIAEIFTTFIATFSVRFFIIRFHWYFLIFIYIQSFFTTITSTYSFLFHHYETRFNLPLCSPILLEFLLFSYRDLTDEELSDALPNSVNVRRPEGMHKNS